MVMRVNADFQVEIGFYEIKIDFLIEKLTESFHTSDNCKLEAELRSEMA